MLTNGKSREGLEYARKTLQSTPFCHGQSRRYPYTLPLTVKNSYWVRVRSPFRTLIVDLDGL